jgi:hypothetical protein
MDAAFIGGRGVIWWERSPRGARFGILPDTAAEVCSKMLQTTRKMPAAPKDSRAKLLRLLLTEPPAFNLPLQT